MQKNKKCKNIKNGKIIKKNKKLNINIIILLIITIDNLNSI